MIDLAVEPAPRPRLADLRHAMRTANGSPTSRACFVASAGHRLGIAPGHVRKYVAASNDKELAALASKPIVWSRLSEDAHRKVAGSSTLAGRAAVRREVAKRLVARLLLPVEVEGLTEHRLVRARVAVAVVGVDFLRGTDTGFEGNFVGEADLGVRLAATRQTARAALRTCETLGWLAVTKRAKGSAARFKLAPLPRPVEAAALIHFGLIERLGDPDLVDHDEFDAEFAELLAGLPDDGWAVQVLQSVEHAAWAYGRTAGERTGLNHRSWLVLLADQAGVNPVDLGVVDRVARQARKDLDRAGVGPVHPGALVDQLDRVARASGADRRSIEARAVRAAEKAQRAADRVRVNTERAEARAAGKASRAKRTGTPRSSTPGPVRTETMTMTVMLPAGFDAVAHADRLLDRVAAAGRGTGWSIDHVDGDSGTVTLVRSGLSG